MLVSVIVYTVQQTLLFSSVKCGCNEVEIKHVLNVSTFKSHSESHNFQNLTYYSGTLGKNYYFLLPISRESIVLGSNFRSGDFDGFTCFEVP